MEIDWRLIFVLAVVFHAIGHSLGIIHTFKLTNLSGMPDNESWLLSGLLKLDTSIIRMISILWVIVMVGFFIVAGVFWFELSWWKPFAVVIVILSVTVFAVWFNSFPMSTQIGAAIGNIVVIVGLFSFT
ncbi:MAG: hypothetical protein ACXAC8_10755 [Candidatus Hodarchaeales archaeon]|jgi:hypothetical protein